MKRWISYSLLKVLLVKTSATLVEKARHGSKLKLNLLLRDVSLRVPLVPFFSGFCHNTS